MTKIQINVEIDEELARRLIDYAVIKDIAAPELVNEAIRVYLHLVHPVTSLPVTISKGATHE